MSIFKLFQKPKHNQAQQLQQAQAKIADLNQQLAFVAKECDCKSTAKLQPIKAKLQTELEFWVAELKQAEATLAQPICSGVGGGLGGLLVRSFRMRHSGLPP
jgi:multidrug resistance efflux pump